MQVEITLAVPGGADFAAEDLGYLLHKNPARVHRRETAAGEVTVFFTRLSDRSATAVLHLSVDPVALVRGAGGGDGLLSSYVNDRPYVANSFLSVAIARSFGQSLAGVSRERQELAERALPLRARVVPVAVAGGEEVIEALFAPLGYRVEVAPLAGEGGRALVALTVSAQARLSDLLSHLYVLVPVLDNAKHYWIDRDEVAKLLDKGEGWLARHPARELIARRALKHRRALVRDALARLDESLAEAEEAQTDEAGEEAEPAPEEALEKPIRLHDLRLDTVAERLGAARVRSVIDLGCGEGRLLRRLVKMRGVERIVGVDASLASLERAAERLHLDRAGEAMRRRVALQMGSLTYGDRRWAGFDAATLVEVIEHVDPARLSALEMAVFEVARPALVVVTTPNREYNALFDGMAEGSVRHPDHRFEWTREEFGAWAGDVAARHGYRVAIEPIGPVDEACGAPSQMAVFRLAGAARDEGGGAADGDGPAGEAAETEAAA